jgi:hypothetical protein
MNTKIIVAIVAVAIIALIGWFVPQQPFVDQASLKNYLDSKISALGGTTNYDSLVINEEGLDEDSRFETDDNANAIFVDAGNDIVTIDGLQTGSKTGCFATSTTGTITEAQLMDHSCIYITATGAGQAALVLTLPATSTMTTLVVNEGECRTWWINADDVAAGTTTTMTLGVGWDLVGLDATGAGTGADVLDGNEFGVLSACREDDTDVTGFIYEYIHAD